MTKQAQCESSAGPAKTPFNHETVPLEGASGAECDFRFAMRQLASSVHVLTVAEGGQWFGMTVTAVSSLCADPPSLLVCVNRQAATHSILARRGSFCLNALGSQHEAIARHFSEWSLRSLRFSEGDWVDTDGSPRLRDATASFNCRVEHVLTFGTHSVVLALVHSARCTPVSPLIYRDGAYGRVIAR